MFCPRPRPPKRPTIGHCPCPHMQIHAKEHTSLTYAPSWHHFSPDSRNKGKGSKRSQHCAAVTLNYRHNTEGWCTMQLQARY